VGERFRASGAGRCHGCLAPAVRILYFSQYFPPEVGATQTRAFEMSRFLAEQGHHATVVTEFPNHPSGIMPPGYRGRLSERKIENGVDVLRLWVRASPEKTFSSRMQFYLSYMGMATLAGSLLRGRYDVVYATSPPLFVAPAGLIAATIRRIPFVLEVRDLWPESAVALGELTNSRAIWLAERLESLLYNRAQRIVAVTRGIEQTLAAKGIPTSKVALIPNGANTDHFHFDAEGAQAVRQELGLQDHFVVMYAGIHGIAQGLETILSAADFLRDRADIIFLFVGEGPRKAALLEMAAQLGLQNVRFLKEVASDRMPAYLSAADCTIVPLRDEPVFQGALPSKMFEVWSCERPIILSAAGEAEEVVKQAGGGIVAPPEDAGALARAILYLQSDRDEGRRMGQRGREFVMANYSRREQARKLEALLLGVVGGH
jgi:glycosyltransferase involved in cell wall biosynthesis